MNKVKAMKRLIFILLFSVNVQASDFCAGFSEGYRTVKGGNAIVPFCPFEPFTPYGSTSFREGIKAGMAAARR